MTNMRTMTAATEYDAAVLPRINNTVVDCNTMVRGERRFVRDRCLADMRRNLQWWNSKFRPRRFEGYDGERGTEAGVWVYRIR